MALAMMSTATLASSIFPTADDHRSYAPSVTMLTHQELSFIDAYIRLPSRDAFTPFLKEALVDVIHRRDLQAAERGNV